MAIIKSNLLNKTRISEFIKTANVGARVLDGDNLYLYKNKYSYVWRLKTRNQVGNKCITSWKTLGNLEHYDLRTARKEADKLRSLMRQGINLHTYTKENSQLGKTFKAVFDIYIREHKRKLKPMSRHKLRSVMNHASALYNTVMDKITENEISEIVKKVKQTAPSIAAILLREIKALYQFAYDEKYIINKLELSVKAKYQITPRNRYLSEKSLGILFKELDNDNTVPIVIKTAIYCLFILMLRREELLSLEWQDVDLVNEKIVIKHTKCIDNFIIKIPKQVVEKLTQLQQITGKNKYVFASRNFYYSGDTLCRYCKKLGIKYSIGEFTPHDARRTGMTLLADKGYDYKVIDTALGHVQTGVNKSYFKTHLSEQRAILLQEYTNIISTLNFDINYS